MTDANHEFLANHDHLRDLGITIETQEEGWVRATLPHRERLTNPGSDVIQGGVVATLIDHLGGAVLRTTLAEPLGTPHASTDLNVSYLEPADGDLTAEGTALRVGGSMGVVRVAVRTGEGDDERLVAEGRVTLHINRG
ncbi:PaaI family thioesterase [Halobacteriales archaeon QS_4_70_19]|nr:MAG: PaaI family thioesterase [Halobacteriales archaeon QS_4_70_19]